MVGTDGSTTQAGRGVGRLVLVIAALLAVGGIAIAFLAMRAGGGAAPEAVALDDDLCPVAPQGIAKSAAVVLDTTKPLAGAPAPSSVLREVSLELAANTELRVYAVQAEANAPLASVGRLCKPYHGGDLSVAAAKDQRDANRDCDDLPAQLTPFLRDAAERFCVRRSALEAKVDALAGAAPRRTVTASHLLDTLGEAKRQLAARPQPRALYVYSDMLEHTRAYSHFDLPWTRWRGDDATPAAVSGAGLTATVFYLPREGITEPLRPRRVHQDYWRTFFAGVDVSFVDYPPAPGYGALPLMDVAATGAPVDADPALEEELERIKQLRERIAGETAALQAQREESIAAVAQLESAGRAPLAGQPGDEGALPEVAAADDEATDADVQPPASSAADATGATPPIAETSFAPNEQTNETPRPTPAAAPLTLPIEVPQAPPGVDLAAATVEELPPCAVDLSPVSLAALAPEGYPGDQRVNYGEGVIVVDYLLGPGGDTIDAEVVLRPELSSVSMQEHFDALAADTVAQVRGWQFDFPAATGNCARRQRQTATFNYASRCVGAPRPSCRTVRTSVTRR